jgi:hypothetical protein
LKKAVEAELDAAFYEVLKPEGYERFEGEPLSYSQTSADGRIRRHVDVEIRSYLSGFGVTLQEVTADGRRRRQLLEEFQGLRAYRVDLKEPEGLKNALATALADLQLYGLPWLAGQPVGTQALEDLRRPAIDRQYQDAIRSAREEFRRGDYLAALRLFDEARRLRPLTAVDEKFRATAEKKATGL